jgi:hypothetical protein
MNDEIDAAKAGLARLDLRLAAGNYPQPKRLWGGAGVVVTGTPPPPPREDDFYPPPRYVVTEHASELSWLIKRIWDACRPVVGGGENKDEFFGRLANAATRYQDRVGYNETTQGLLGAVLHEAWAMVEEIEDGEFRTLMVTSGGLIYDDLIEEAERDGYLTAEETWQRFIERVVE